MPAPVWPFEPCLDDALLATWTQTVNGVAEPRAGRTVSVDGVALFDAPGSSQPGGLATRIWARIPQQAPAAVVDASAASEIADGPRAPERTPARASSAGR